MRFFLIAGPESSGNRVVAAALVRAGCRGEGSTNQPSSKEELNNLLDTVTDVVAIKHHNLAEWIEVAKKRHFRVIVVVLIRAPFANVSSAVSRGHTLSYTDRDKAIIEAAASLCEVTFLTYEGLNNAELFHFLNRYSLDTSTMAYPLDLVGQDAPSAIVNQNFKHY